MVTLFLNNNRISPDKFYSWVKGRFSDPLLIYASRSENRPLICFAYSFLVTAEEDGGYPVYIPALSFGWHAEIWVNNQLVYTIYE